MASWYNSSWKRRIPCVLDTSASSGTVDATISVPKTLQVLWDNTQSSGEDIRVTAADGYTELTYQLQSWNQSTQTGTIELDNVTVPQSNEFTIVWVYFDNSGASDAQGSFTATSAVTGYLTPEKPSSITPITPERVGASNPRLLAPKTTEDILLVYVPLDLELSGRCGPEYESGMGFEGVESFIYKVYASASEVTTMRDWTLTRVIDCGGALYARLAIKGGVDDTNYVALLDIQSTEGRRVRRALEFQVRDISEST